MPSKGPVASRIGQYDDNQKIFYVIGKDEEKGRIRAAIRESPLELSCEGFLIASRYPYSQHVVEIRPFPPHMIDSVQYQGAYEFSAFPQGKVTVTKIRGRFGDNDYHVLHSCDKKAYELAATVSIDLERRAGVYKQDCDILYHELRKLRKARAAASVYLDILRRLSDCSAEQWLCKLRKLSEMDPDRYQWFMCESMSQEERAFAEALIQNPGELFKGSPRTELEFRKLFDRYAFLFGFRIVHYTTTCPDYILARNGTELRAEAELYSHNFVAHKHKVAACDMIVCWQRTSAPEGLDVFELSTGRLFSKDGNVEHLLPEHDQASAAP